MEQICQRQDIMATGRAIAMNDLGVAIYTALQVDDAVVVGE